MTDADATPIHRALGLTDTELDDIIEILGREPNRLELSMYSVMWSEHCSYKSSKVHLRRLPTTGEGVLVGPGENAGVMDVGDGIAAAIRIESHNHPSFIEPYQGAATGAGGILRDIFTMGARPIALMDPLRFGPLDDPRSRWVAEGVVSGISGYGNSVGVPTVGGEVVFDECYKGNPLVNVLCLGILPVERLVLAKATGTGNLAVLLGSATGRDGIGGVSVLASAGFEEGSEDKRPAVQVGDPFEEKRLIEACLALLDAGLVVGIQDLGGAGLTCAASETAANGKMGMDFDVSAVPRREDGMEPFEVMTSESQERMLAIVTPDDLPEVLRLCERWEVLATVVGKVTDPDEHGVGMLRIVDGFDGEVLADVPASSLHDAAPVYERPLAEPADRAARQSDAPAAPTAADATEALLGLLYDTTWVSSQYDHQLFLNTVEGPGGDAVVLRLKHPTTGVDTGRGLALTTDGNHRWCAVDPRQGTALTLAESILNLACVGARPMAVVNCLNFGNPEHPEVMWQLSESVDGLSEACLAFGLPVIGGNVSLYNESRGTDIDPTPVIGLLGVVDELTRRPPGVTLAEGDQLLLLGDDLAGPAPSLAGSAQAWAAGSKGGALPAFDPQLHSRVADLVRNLVTGEVLSGVHDASSGGLGVALAELSVRSGVGVDVTGLPGTAHLFAEAPSRVVVAVAADHVDAVLAAAAGAQVPAVALGTAGGDRFALSGPDGTLVEVGVADLTATWRDRLPDALGAGTTQA
ncbi:phosphoribosylformylglycinamidine synthase subunit PurL [Aquihabitans sp. G128]|uniref:phosphoribosylformylglycinamidine synthase subunit PurL n=1 Tax=Aquihabitans sp. G128 TaxID=2849779 RepID=UPI001C2161D0|nr:phosphoribosylformylglycinamidine synthase subunit PurL [Aquihabitans sp. G128]QXC59945.1 phosphoribosylformylglycinamidine synthase subunit PurL [Aquihabitans sp. G128]